jgi:hypothetical protein
VIGVTLTCTARRGLAELGLVVPVVRFSIRGFLFMRRMPLLAVLALAAASTAPAARADSTTTQTVPPGGTMRSSPDAAPSPANPVIVNLTAARSPEQGCHVNCQYGDVTYTITMKDKHERGRADGLEGPNGYDFVGPQVDVTSSQTDGPGGGSEVRLSFEIDSSAYTPDFYAGRDTGINSNQFFFEEIGQDGRNLNRGGPGIFVVEKLADGDLRLTPEKENGRDSLLTGSFDLLEQSFYVRNYLNFREDNSLQTVLRKGVSIYYFGNYESAVKAKITLSPAVARKLHLKSKVIGKKNFSKAGEGTRRIQLTRAAVKALKKYEKVVVYIETEHSGPRDQVKTKKSKATLEVK